MNRSKLPLLTAFILIVLGLVILCASAAAMHFDMRKLNTAQIETNTFEIGDAFDSLSIRGTTEDILLTPSQDGKCTVICREDTDMPHTAGVMNGTLTITAEEKHRIAFGLRLIKGPQITICLPESSYNELFIDSDTSDVRIPGDFTFEKMSVTLKTGDADVAADVKTKATLRTSTGRISLHDMQAGEITLSTSTGKTRAENVICSGTLDTTVSTGETEMTGVSCADLISSGSTGDLELKNVTASGSFRIKRSTGDVEFDACDAEEIEVETSTGDVSGHLLSAKLFSTKTETGDVDVPASGEGGKCRIVTETGDIEIRIP